MEMPIDLQHQMMGYDRTTTMFSPEGHLLQVEYAEKTIRLGAASLGLVCSDGVVIVADKRAGNKLLSDSYKIFEIDSHVMASAAGILSDARVLVERVQLLAQQNRVTYDTAIDVESIVKEITSIKQAATQYGGVRPFGVAIIVTGINPDGDAKLFVTDVTGNYIAYKAIAVGENDDKIKELLEKSYKESLDVEGGIKLALAIFRKVLGRKFNLARFDVAYITKKEKEIKRVASENLRKYSR